MNATEQIKICLLLKKELFYIPRDYDFSLLSYYVPYISSHYFSNRSCMYVHTISHIFTNQICIRHDCTKSFNELTSNLV